MTTRRKIKVVAGLLQESAMIRLWESIAQQHDVELLVQSPQGFEPIATGLPVVEFPVVNEMPNFFRDIERYVKGADMVVACESSRLYSFQALRVARKMGIPFVCLAHEYKPFVYDRYANIRAIQKDIHEHTSLFLATSNKAAKLLGMEGVNSDRILRISAATDECNFIYSEALAEKFRAYIGVPEQSPLVTIKMPLDELEPSITVARGIRLAINGVPDAIRKSVRFLVCGQGGMAEKIKYEIADMGLGGQSMFLAQDLRPFYRDVLSATDIMVEGRGENANSAGSVPWHVVSAAGLGVDIVAPRGSITEDVLSRRVATYIDEFTPMDISGALVSLFERGRIGREERLSRGSLVHEVMSLQAVSESVCKLIEELCTHDEGAQRRQGLADFVKQHQVPVTFKNANEVLVVCEEAREFSSECELNLYSEILRIRGDALIALSRADEALTSFEDSLRQNGLNYHALRGLGYMAWQGHSHEEALRFFKRALAIEPNDYQSLVGVGLVYRRLQMFNESVYWLQKAVALGGLESSSLSLLVQACLENASEPHSIAILESIRETVGDHPNLSTAINKLESHR
jgi:hypothetical protein